MLNELHPGELLIDLNVPYKLFRGLSTTVIARVFRSLHLVKSIPKLPLELVLRQIAAFQQLKVLDKSLVLGAHRLDLMRFK